MEVLKSVSKCEAGLIYTTYISCYTTPHHVSEHAMDTTSVQLYSYISFCLFISLFRWDNEGLHTVLISLLAQTFLKKSVTHDFSFHKLHCLWLFSHYVVKYEPPFLFSLTRSLYLRVIEPNGVCVDSWSAGVQAFSLKTDHLGTKQTLI